MCVGIGWKLLFFSGFKLSFPTINYFCCQPANSKFCCFFFSPANDFPSLQLLVKKVLPSHVEILSTNFNNFINVTVPLQCSACFSSPGAPKMPQYSAWASRWKHSLKEHGSLAFFNRWLNAGSRTLTFLKMSQRVWEKLDLACWRMCRVAPASLLPQPSGNEYSSHLGNYLLCLHASPHGWYLQRVIRHLLVLFLCAAWCGKLYMPMQSPTACLQRELTDIEHNLHKSCGLKGSPIWAENTFKQTAICLVLNSGC